jgi:beta-glucosidase
VAVDIETLLSELTLEEKVSLCRGSDFMSTNPVERLGIPRMWVTDGPHGARGRGWGNTTSAAIPCGTALGATWDVDLLRDVGVLMGNQVASKGANILLGPTMNIHRAPLAGRNFECYSEDPILSARIAVAFVQGLQSVPGIGACIKHYVANDQEFERMTISSEVDQRSLREVYLVPFEACVKEAHAWSIMPAYNRLNGTYCAEHEWLLQDVLRGEWGFEGYVISDWWGTKSTVPSAKAGLDLEMPGPGLWFGQGLLEAVQKGEVSEATIDWKVRRLLLTLSAGGRFDSPADTVETALDRPEDRALLRRAGADAIVLLKNEGNVLPLRNVKKLAVIGPNADVARFGGGGSSEVIPHYLVTPLDGIRVAMPDTDIVFARGSTPYTMLPAIDPRFITGFDVDFFPNTDLEGEPVAHGRMERAAHRWIGNVPVESDRFSARLTTTFTPDEDGEWTFGLVAAGRAKLFVDGELVIDNWTEFDHSPVFFGMGSKEKTGAVGMKAGEPRTLVVEYRAATTFAAGVHVGCIRPMGPDRIEEAVQAARGSDAAVVIVGLDPESETEGHDRETMDLTGDQADLIRAVAAVQPNTVVVVNAGCVVSMDWADDVPAVLYAWYGGQECGNAIADVLTGTVNPSGKLPTTIPMRYEDNAALPNYPGAGGEVHYKEGVFVGYRHHDSKDIDPRFAFGHGLSYTSFVYGSLDVEQTGGGSVVASVDVTNVGDVAGKEVAQLYVSDLQATVPRPPKELKAFQKVALEAGETKTVRFALDSRAFSFWDGEWIVEPGVFDLLVGSSSRDIRARAAVSMP